MWPLGHRKTRTGLPGELGGRGHRRVASGAQVLSLTIKRSVPGNPAVPGIPNMGMPNAGLPSSGMPSAGLPAAGMPNAGIPAAGMPNAGIPSAGMPGAGMPSAGGEKHAFLAVGSKEANSGPPFNFPGNFGGSNAFGPPLPPPGLGGAFGDARPGMPSVGSSGLPGLGLDVPGFGGGPNNLSGPGFGGGPQNFGNGPGSLGGPPPGFGSGPPGLGNAPGHLSGPPAFGPGPGPGPGPIHIGGPGREAALPPGRPPHAHLLTGTPAEPPEPARPPAHEGEECLPSD